jgi:hypothetical protein
MKYTRDRFTEEEIEQIESLGMIVCYIFGIEEDELRGKVRQRDFTDARKVLASCASSNIDVKSSYNYKSTGHNHLGLSSWYLNTDHSSVSYSVNKAAELYQVDEKFKVLYDCVMAIINNPNDDTLSKLNKYSWQKPVTWEEVRDNKIFRHKLRFDLAPKEVINGIVSLYERGYGGTLISNKYSVSSSFVNYVIEKLNISRVNRGLSFVHASHLIARRSTVVKSAPKSNVYSKSNY